MLIALKLSFIELQVRISESLYEFKPNGTN
jgi:hypothetical protein